MFPGDKVKNLYIEKENNYKLEIPFDLVVKAFCCKNLSKNEDFLFKIYMKSKKVINDKWML